MTWCTDASSSNIGCAPSCVARDRRGHKKRAESKTIWAIALGKKQRPRFELFTALLWCMLAVSVKDTTAVVLLSYRTCIYPCVFSTLQHYKTAVHYISTLHTLYVHVGTHRVHYVLYCNIPHRPTPAPPLSPAISHASPPPGTARPTHDV